MKIAFLQPSPLIWILSILPSLLHADVADRIEEILHRQTYDPTGQVLWSEWNATIEGCGIQLHLNKPNSCEKGESFFAHTDYIDVRTLVTNKEEVWFRDLTDTQYESLGGSAGYEYRSWYYRILIFVYDRSRKIVDQEYENFPRDVESRLRAIGNRNRTEIDPSLYSMSWENTQYCSGVEVTSPLPSSPFRFYMNPSELEEFAILIEELAHTCDADLIN